MKVAIRYFSRGGNTKKLAEAIAKAVGVPAQTVADPLPEDVDILFLGSSVYFHGVDERVKNFIAGISVHVGKAVNFSTAGLITSTYKQVAKLLEAKGIPLATEEFACKGAFAGMHRGHPDDADCAAAAEFASRVLSADRGGDNSQ